MDVLRDIDEKQTGRNVDRFFKTKFPRLQRYATPTLTSPQFDKVGSGGSGNGEEMKYVKAAEAANELKRVARAVNACNHMSRRILRGLYYDGSPDREMMAVVNYQRTQYYTLREIALNQFADFYDTFGGLDLHEYSENTGKTAEKDRTE